MSDCPCLSVFSKVFLCILLSAHIAVGSVYLNECPQQSYIPIYLIVMGVFGLVMALINFLPFADQDFSNREQVCVTWHLLMFFFIACWFIAGNVWIYSIYEPNYNKTIADVEPYCDKALYLFAFWTTTLFYIFLTLSQLCSCCMGMPCYIPLYCYLSSRDRRQPHPIQT